MDRFLGCKRSTYTRVNTVVQVCLLIGANYSLIKLYLGFLSWCLLLLFAEFTVRGFYTLHLVGVAFCLFINVFSLPIDWNKQHQNLMKYSIKYHGHLTGARENVTSLVTHPLKTTEKPLTGFSPMPMYLSFPLSQKTT